MICNRWKSIKIAGGLQQQQQQQEGEEEEEKTKQGVKDER